MRQYSVGAGLLNRTIDALPFELSLPGGYRYCGPGTRLTDRLARGEKGINPLDELCKSHDIAYHLHKDSKSRSVADRILAEKAWQRFNAKDTPFGEKAAAWFVTTAMKAKSKLGAGGVRSGGKNKQVTLRELVKRARLAVRGAGVKSSKALNAKSMRAVTGAALKAAKAMKKGRFLRRHKGERVIPLPKSGGVLPLLPIFAGLSAIGSLAGGAAGVAKAISETKDAKKKLAELQRHNETMEAIALRGGKGLYLKPYKKGGLGLYMTPYTRYAKNY